MVGIPVNMFYKNNQSDKIWWVDNPETIGEWLFSFDKKQVFNMFADYPHNLTLEHKAIIGIDEAMVIKGALPSRQLKLILAWCVLHQDELMQNWELSKDGKPLNRINPLV